MDILERMSRENKAEGGFVFVSHSHADIAQVRQLRNALEQAGFEPLCFYLKCMDKCEEDPALREELRSLLRREIDAREWFVYVNSKHSENSSWVQYERDCVAKSGNKKVFQMDLDTREAPEKMANKILKNLRVYLSYSHKDAPLARRIKQKLLEKDYRVFLDEDATTGVNWLESTASVIQEASRSGCVLALLTENALKSSFVRQELYLAMESGGNIVPVLVGDVALTPDLRMAFGRCRVYQLPGCPSDGELDRLVQFLGRRIAE